MEPCIGCRGPSLGDRKMINTRIPVFRNQTLITLSVFVLAILIAWQLAQQITADNLRSLIYVAAGFIAIAAAVTILRNWRSGVYMFFLWMLFEDLFRKYMGNGPALFFGKDILAGLVYISFFTAVRRGSERRFRAPFLLFVGLFFLLGTMQVFNPNSPHILYGLLGFKTYFYYIPMMYVGYALIRSDEDLTKVLVWNAAASALIAGLGIAQAILGNSFLNPAKLAPELQDLGNLSKITPLTNQIFNLPDSVFVSAGRFDQFLILAFILVMGTTGYLLLSNLPGRKTVLLSTGIITISTLLCGSRGAFMYVLISAIALVAVFLWGAPWRQRQAHRMIKMIRRSFIAGAVGLALILFLFPQEAGSRIAYYTETLLPDSSAYQMGDRTWAYPIQNLTDAFSRPNWLLGNGIGTASLGGQYVAKLIGKPPIAIGVEEGFGTLIIEMGIITPLIWFLWTGSLLYYCWGIVYRLRQTRLFPLAFAIFWFAFLLFYPMTYGGLTAYQNYTNNIYLWLLVGILFRLPEIQAATPSFMRASTATQRKRGGFQF
jgi:hypothetical protein